MGSGISPLNTATNGSLGGGKTSGRCLTTHPIWPRPIKQRATNVFWGALTRSPVRIVSLSWWLRHWSSDDDVLGSPGMLRKVPALFFLLLPWATACAPAPGLVFHSDSPANASAKPAPRPSVGAVLADKDPLVAAVCAKEKLCVLPTEATPAANNDPHAHHHHHQQ